MTEIATTGGAADFNIDDYLTDPRAELEGVWRSIGKDKNGQPRRIKLARLENDEYLSELRRKQRANQALLEQNDDEAFALAKKIQREVVAKTIIKGLEVSGKEVTYNYEKGLAMLENNDFLSKVVEMSKQADAYRLQQEEQTAKN